MAKTAQDRAIRNYRRRLAQRGMARFEVVGLDRDRGLIRSVARKLAGEDAGATQLRAYLQEAVVAQPVGKGTLLDILRRSPLVGADVKFTRERSSGRPVDL